MKPIRILLSDDHVLVRAGIRALLQGLEGIEVVAEAGDGQEALKGVEEHRPDVVMMDIAMPGLNGLEAARRIAEGFPGVRVVMLSMHADEEYVLEALRAGAAGYLLKDVDAGELERALRAVARGETYLTSAVSGHVVADYRRRMGESGPADPLTPRQREVLKLIAEGRSTKEIAYALQVSVKTIETHRAQVMERLGIHDVAGLVRYAIRAGIVPAE